MPRVVLVPTGEQFSAEPGEAVLAAALRAGLNLPHSCKGGHCGSCRARLLAGEVDYPWPRPAGISDEEIRDGFALLCQARAHSDLRVEARAVRPAPDVEVRSLPCRAERLVRLTDDVMAMWLRLPAVETLPFRPGQYLDVMLPEGRRRSFSIASAPTDGALLELHVRRASSEGFTARVFDSLQPGALLRIEGPLGQFWLRLESPRPVLMIGGGTGYAPLRAMLRQLLASGDRRPVTLYWGVRSAADLYEHEWLRQLEAERASFRYVPVLSQAAAADDSTLRRGWVHEAALADVPALAGFDVYTAGPPALIEAIRTQFVAHGLPREQLWFDSFDYAPDSLASMQTSNIR
jgi:CDP-4-dehydro-6-deoxyglucose reductase